FTASKPDRIRFAVQALDKGSKTISNLYVGVIPAENTGGAGATFQQAGHLTRVFRTANLGTSWTFVIDTPGSVEPVTAPAFLDLFPGGQGDLQLGFAVDPKNPDVLYLAGDTQINNGDKSPVHNQEFSGRIFQLNAQINWTAAITGNAARGDQIVSDGA